MSIKNIPQSLLDAVNKVLSEAHAEEHPMIEVDGVMRHRNNSLGQPIHHTDEGIRNFHRWFGNSQVVDEHGRPQVVYHATKHKFDSFDYDKIGNGYNRFGPAFYFTNDPKTLDIYKGEGGNLIPAYIRASKIQKTDAMSKEDINNFFDSLQVKKFNNGYDATNDHENIRNSALEEPDRAFSRIISNANIYIDKNDFLNGLHKIGVHATIRNVFGHPEYAVYDNTNIKATNNSGAFSHPTKITESIEHPMIEVDGVMRHRHNSLGQPIHHTDEGIKNFHRWFGASKAVDEHGRPKVYYHGTSTKFDEFKLGVVPPMGKSDSQGFYFTDSESYANQYGNNIKRVYLAVNKPYEVQHDSFEHTYISPEKLSQLESNSYDSVLFRGSEKYYPEIVAFRPHQIKSIDNSGAFAHPTKITESTKVYYRGTDNKDEPALISSGTLRPSTDHLSGKTEAGVSVSDVPDVGKYFRYMYKVTGTELPEVGSDGEPLLDPNTMKFVDWVKAPTLTESEDYRESHTAPKPENSSPAHDLTHGAYPEDFYSSKGARLYGDGRDDDYKVHSQLRTLRNRPEAEVNIYRAVPNDSKITEINSGDWVTTNLQYAHDHGERFDSHKILSKRVKAKELFTDGNSFHEFGYHPAKD